MKSHATDDVKREISVDVAWVLSGYCEELNPFFV